jgi:hypothetical protein
MTKSVWKRSASGRTVRRKNGKSPPFVMLPKYMITSAAWCSLSGIAMAAYVELGRRYDGTNNGRLHLSAGELSVLRRCSKDTAARGLRELVEKGFADVVKASGFNIKDRTAQAAEYRLTLFHCDVTRHLPSKEFMKWQQPDSERSRKNISRSDFRDSTVRLVVPRPPK